MLSSPERTTFKGPGHIYILLVCVQARTGGLCFSLSRIQHLGFSALSVRLLIDSNTSQIRALAGKLVWPVHDCRAVSIIRAHTLSLYYAVHAHFMPKGAARREADILVLYVEHDDNRRLLNCT